MSPPKQDSEDEDERLATVIALYQQEKITLGDAARLVGVNRWTMQDIFRAHEVELRLGLADEESAQYEAKTAKSLKTTDERDLDSHLAAVRDAAGELDDASIDEIKADIREEVESQARE